jgi:hypothetical protein
MDERMGCNINGPSLIKVPDWVERPLGLYYLYFAHHDGKYIRLAYSDELAGPWRMHIPGALSLDDSYFGGHIASPDVHIDDSSQSIRMYFHGSDTTTGGGVEQSTRLATSTDGLNFTANPEQLGNPYWRVFRWNNHHYALAMPGVFYRSADGVSNFEQGPTLFSANMRHSAVTVQGNDLVIYYTTVGDTPEHIKRSVMSLQGDWMNWHVSDPIEILRPEFDWEGSGEPPQPSTRGLVHGRVNQLRDPALLEENSRNYLLYSVAGESGIAIAELLD